MNKPLVTICIPTFNGEEFIAEAMESAINQTYSNLEIVVSDDASTDGTLEVIQQFKKKTPIPIYIHEHKPNGIGANWNNCVKYANGEYIKFLFQDDVLLPNCTEMMVSVALIDHKIGLVYCKRNIIFNSNNAEHIKWVNDYGILHESWHNLNFYDTSIVKGKTLLNDLNLLNFPENKIGEPTAVLLKKDCFDKIGFFDTELKQCLDIEFWYRVMKYFSVGFVNDTLVKFRLHDQQASSVNLNSSLNEIGVFELKIYKNFFWYLNKKNILVFFLKYNFIGKLYIFFKGVFKRIKRKIKLQVS